MVKEHALIIGGTRGIGREVVDRFLENGFDISVLSRRPPDTNSHQNVTYVQSDISKPGKLLEVLKKIVREKGKIKSLVFMQRYRGDIASAWDGEIKVSLEGTRNVIDDLIDSFCEEASIVVAISVASRFIASEQPLSYHLGKAALEQLVRYYAVTLGPKGVRVNGVSFASVLKKESKHYYEENPDLMNLYRTITPLKRMGSASEIADGIAFLVSDSASFINGHNLIIDGGISLQWHESLARELVNFSKIDVTRDDDS